MADDASERVGQGVDNVFIHEPKHQAANAGPKTLTSTEQSGDPGQFVNGLTSNVEFVLDVVSVTQLPKSTVERCSSSASFARPSTRRGGPPHEPDDATRFLAPGLGDAAAAEARAFRDKWAPSGRH